MHVIRIRLKRRDTTRSKIKYKLPLKFGNPIFKIGRFTAVLIFSGWFPFPLLVTYLLFRRSFMTLSSASLWTNLFDIKFGYELLCSCVLSPSLFSRIFFIDFYQSGTYKIWNHIQTEIISNWNYMNCICVYETEPTRILYSSLFFLILVPINYDNELHFLNWIYKFRFHALKFTTVKQDISLFLWEFINKSYIIWINKFYGSLIILIIN